MLRELGKEWKKAIEESLVKLSGGEEIPPVNPSTPPSEELGDIAFPLFMYSKIFRKSPNEIAREVEKELGDNHPSGKIIISGPYLNVKYDIPSVAGEIISSVSEGYGSSSHLNGKKIMIEFSCPNTNKPLHLGHMRNDSIGESVSNLLKKCGADVMKVNLINNRGIHICKSMLAYMKFGNGETPDSTGEKGDHFVGRYYVKFSEWKSDTKDEEAQELLRKWESGDEETIALWKKMNGWTLEGLSESYGRMGISFDKLYYESDTYMSGRDEVLRGLGEGIFEKESDGSVQVDLTDIGLDKKVLLRRDGTTLYITQDIGTAISRHNDWPFDSLIYVVASEQNYHFKVLFRVLGMLGYDWADELRHLSYGMVNLPNGRMKSREGTVVDADDLIEELTNLAEREIVSKGREDAVEGVRETAEKIALGALNYYLLQVQPRKDMVFDPEESISFNGNTGPYMQYMAARINSIRNKYTDTGTAFDGTILTDEDEIIMIKLMDSFPQTVERAAEAFDPSIIASWLYDAAKTFSHYYHENRVLNAGSDKLVKARVEMLSALLIVMKEAFSIIGIPFLPSM